MQRRRSSWGNNAGQVTMDDIVKKSEDVDSSGKVNSDGYCAVGPYIQFRSNHLKIGRCFIRRRRMAWNRGDPITVTHIMRCVEILVQQRFDRGNRDVRLKAKLIDEQIEEGDEAVFGQKNIN